MRVKRIIIILFVLLTFNPCFGCNSRVIKDSLIHFDTVYIGSNKTHFYLNDFINGKLAFRVFIEGGERYKYIQYRDNGSIKEIGFLNKTSPELNMKSEYYQNGNIKSTTIVFGNFYTTDTLLGESHEVIRLDSHIIEYYENGKIQKEFSIINGELNGEYCEYDDQGVLKSKGFYYNGQKKGIYYHYNEVTKEMEADTLFFPSRPQ